MRGVMQPQIAASPDGRVQVAFGKGTAIYHTVSNDGGRTFSKPVQIAALPKLALGMRRGPRITATDRILAVSAISHESGDLFAWNSADGGAKWSKAATINTVPKCAREGLHAMAGDGRGLAVLTWLDLRSGGTELWSAVSRDGGVSWGGNTRAYRSPDGHICECCHPSAAISPRGEIAVMWRNWLGGSRDMYVAMSGDGGGSFGAAQKLGSGTWKLDGCPMDGGALAFTAGDLLTTWRREKSAFSAPAKGAAPEAMLSQTGAQPIVLAEKGGASFVWQEGPKLMLQRGRAKPVTLSEHGAFASAATLPNGGAVVAWEDGADEKKIVVERLEAR